jgi:hypothetical protein
MMMMNFGNLVSWKFCLIIFFQLPPYTLPVFDLTTQAKMTTPPGQKFKFYFNSLQSGIIAAET